jgi:hypothetical protein
MKRRPWTRCIVGYGTKSHCPRHATTFVRKGEVMSFFCAVHGSSRRAVPISSDHWAPMVVDALDRRRRERSLKRSSR